MEKFKYPRTFHAPWTAHKTTDDKIWDVDALVEAFAGKEIVITEKLDGENTTVYSDGSFHARSIDGRMHPSRNRMVGIAKGLGAKLPSGYRLCGEYLYAEHSIRYEYLPSYFMVFGIYDETNTCLSWDTTRYVAEELEITLVPEIWRGPWEAFYSKHNEFTDLIMMRILRQTKEASPDEIEGYVVRTTEGFHYDDLSLHCAKYVRSNHIQTDEHWMFKPVVPNRLAKRTYEY